jgi:hypothetical protein
VSTLLRRRIFVEELQEQHWTSLHYVISEMSAFFSDYTAMCGTASNKKKKKINNFILDKIGITLTQEQETYTETEIFLICSAKFCVQLG